MQQFIFQNYNAVICSLVLTATVFLLFRPLAIKTSLVDKPNRRKAHDFHTPIIGGVCIFLSSILTILIFNQTFSMDFFFLLVCVCLMLVLGVIDDKFDLPASTKLFSQVVITTVFIVFSDCAVTNLGTPLGLLSPLELGLLSFPFTLLAIVALTNAINMIDGCDGLAASLVIFALSAVLILGNTGSENPKMFFLLIVLPSLKIFLFFNFSNSKSLKTFLGDGGSLFLGFLVAVNLVEFAETTTVYDPSIVLWFAAIPIIDFCTVVARRILLKRKITRADRSHIHHYILSWGFSHLYATLLLSGAALALILFGGFVAKNYPSLSFFSFLLLFITYASFRLFDGRVE